MKTRRDETRRVGQTRIGRATLRPTRASIPQPGAKTITDLIRIIYTSEPFGYDAATLNGVLVDARRCNSRDGVTGALVCRQDIYMQLLEGPDAIVRATFDRIKRDDRHLGIRLHVSQPVPDRLFGQWAMHHDPARSWFWSQSEISGGAIDRASPDDFNALFETLAERLRNGASD